MFIRVSGDGQTNMAWFAVGPNRKDQLLRALRIGLFVISVLVAVETEDVSDGIAERRGDFRCVRAEG